MNWWWLLGRHVRDCMQPIRRYRYATYQVILTRKANHPALLRHKLLEATLWFAQRIRLVALVNRLDSKLFGVLDVEVISSHFAWMVDFRLRISIICLSFDLESESEVEHAQFCNANPTSWRKRSL